MGIKVTKNAGAQLADANTWTGLQTFNGGLRTTIGQSGIGLGENPPSAYNVISSAGAMNLRPAGGGDGLEIQPEGNGQVLAIRSLTELTTIDAAVTTDTTIQIPADAIVLAVSTRVTVQPTGTSDFDIGVTGATTRYGNGISSAADTTSDGTDDAARYYSAAVSLTITPNTTPSDNAGRIRVTIFYIESTPPSS